VGSGGGGARGVQALQALKPALVHGMVCAVLGQGDAVLFGTTREGGAIMLQLFSGEESDKLYASSLEELEELVKGVEAVAVDS